MYVTLVREETFTVRTQVHLPELNRRTSWGGEQGGASPLVHLRGTSLNTKHHSRLWGWPNTNETGPAPSGSYNLNGMIRHNTQTGARQGVASREQELEKDNPRAGPTGAKPWCPCLNYGGSGDGQRDLGWESGLGGDHGRLG